MLTTVRSGSRNYSRLYGQVAYFARASEDALDKESFVAVTSLSQRLDLNPSPRPFSMVGREVARRRRTD